MLTLLQHYGRRGKGFTAPDHFLIKNLKAVHLLFATAWAGGALSMQALSFLKLSGIEPERAEQVQYCLHFVDTWVVIPGLLGCALTGYIYSSRTAIGYFKYAWIGFKWCITAAAAFWGLFFWSGLGDRMIGMLAQYGMDAPLRFVRAFILPESMWQGALQLAVILSMCLISVYRPLSFRRRQREPIEFRGGH